MKLPLSWLKEYVDVDVTVEELADKLTFSGTEVESIEQVGGTYEGLIVGEVVACEPHPKADRLTCCKVHDGTSTVDVVCGADNVAVGVKAPFAPVGACLPDGMKIKRAKLRGQESFGMLCAEDELGLSDDHAGIMILPPDAEPGVALADILGPPETVLDLEVTWNRADCLSIIGMAREIAALYGTRVKLPSFDLTCSGGSVDDLVSVEIEDAVGCPRYTARVLSDVTLDASPWWLQKRLMACGVRPISNIVDVTNYVMLETGHPLHAFDYALVGDQKIIVRRAASGEKISTLDGVERPITPEMLLIADGARPVAVAGVMGGAGSEIADTTTSVLLESASFHAPMIRQTSSRLGLLTESSHRFERGVNPETVEWAGRRAAALMAELSGATIAEGVVDVYPGEKSRHTVTCRFARVRGLLGIDLDSGTIVDILSSLEIPVVDQNEATCTVEVPGFRADITREADVIEEIARMHGIDRVPASVPAARVVPEADDSRTVAIMECRRNMMALGLSEAMHYSFLSSDLLEKFCQDEEAPNGVGRSARVILPNPVSAEHDALRNTLVPQMVESLGRNLSRQVPDAGLFEIGRVFFKNPDGTVGEEERLCIGLMGKVGRRSIDRRARLTDEEMFHWLKGVLEELAIATGIHAADLSAATADGLGFAPLAHPFFSEGQAAAVTLNGTPCGVLGLIRKKIRHTWRMQDSVAVAELRLKPLLDTADRHPDLQPIPAFPGISRDMALVVDSHVSHAEIMRVIGSTGIAELTSAELFDIFSGEGIGKGKKSLAYSLMYRSLERTLTDEEANGFHERIKKALRDELNVEIRES